MRPLLAAIVLAALHGAPDAPPSPQVIDLDLRLAKPALVRIESRASATVSVATIDFDQPALTAFARSDVSRLLSSGQRFPSLDAAQRTVENDLEREFVANPGPYLKLGERVSDPYETYRVGSGWVAGAGGFVVTAASALVDDAAVVAVRWAAEVSPSGRPFAPIAVAAVLFALDSVAVTTVLRRHLLRARRAR